MPANRSEKRKVDFNRNNADKVLSPSLKQAMGHRWSDQHA
jgi:hypothetical protein